MKEKEKKVQQVQQFPIGPFYRLVAPTQWFLAVQDVTKDGIMVVPSESPQKTLKLISKVLNKQGLKVKGNWYSIIMKLEDFNYQVMGDESRIDIVTKYAQILNSFDHTMRIQITLVNRRVTPAEVVQKLKVKETSEYAKEYNQILMRLFEQTSLFQQDKYFTIATFSEEYDTAKALLLKISEDVKRQFRAINSDATLLSRGQILSLLRSFYTFKSIPPVDSNIREKTIDIIAPASVAFRRNYTVVDEDSYLSFMFMQYPPVLSDKILYSLLNTNTESIITIHLHAMDNTEAIKLVNNLLMDVQMKLTKAQENAAKAGIVYTPQELKDQEERLIQIKQDVQNNNMRLFQSTTMVTAKGDDYNSLVINKEKLQRVLLEYSGYLAPANAYQEMAYNSVLPLGVNFMPKVRTLNTANAAVLIPFTTKNYTDKGGIYYGINIVNNLPIIFDRTTLRNPNGFILGTPGSGKSFFAKKEIVEIFLNRTEDDIMVIDPEREYRSLANLLGGTDIVISESSANHINPLDISANYSDAAEENPIAFKSSFIMSLFGSIINLSEEDKSVIDKTVTILYQQFKHAGRPPTLKDFSTVLNSFQDPMFKAIASRLNIALLRYIQGSLDVFSYPTNIDINNRFVVFDIKDLGPELKTFGMFVILDQIWNRITQNREVKKRTWIYIDEIYLLFQNTYAQEFLFKLFKRARKWGAIITGITQNIEDLLRSEQARTMLANTDFLVLFNQAPTDRILLQNLLHLSDREMQYITSSPPGSGLLGIDHIFLPIKDSFPRDTKLYQAMTTSFGEAND